MTTAYFGVYYTVSGHPKNGDWTDTFQWYSQDGFSNEFGVTPGTLLGRLPTEADTVVFNQAVTSHVPTSWTGTIQDAKLGSSIVPATGTWSGLIYGSCTIYGTTSSPVISGTLGSSIGSRSASVVFYGGRLTSDQTYPDNSYGVNAPTVITGNINSTGGSLTANGGTISGNLNIGLLYINTTTITGIITATVQLNITTGTFANVTLGSLSSFYMSGGSLPNVTSIQTAAGFSLSGGSLPAVTSLNGSGSVTITGGSMASLTSIGATTQVNGFYMYGGSLPAVTSISSSFTFYYYGGSLPAVGTIRSYGNIGLYNVVTTATLTVTGYPAANIVIQNSTFSGAIYFANVSNSSLYITRNSTITTDISTTVTNCGGFYIYSGTFTHPNPWIFGNSSTAVTVNLGCDVTKDSPFVPYTLETLNTNKNITIYCQASKSIKFNVRTTQPTGGSFSPTQYGTFTGLISLIPVTGQTYPTPLVGGGTYAPVVTAPAVFNGSTYSLANSSLPYDWGFASNGGVYSATIYVSNLPSTADILGTLI